MDSPVRIVIALLVALPSVDIAFAQAPLPSQSGIVTEEQKKSEHGFQPCRVHLQHGEGPDSALLFPSAVTTGCVDRAQDTLRIPPGSGVLEDVPSHNQTPDLFGQNSGASLASRQSLKLGITNNTIARESRKRFDRLTLSSELPLWRGAHGYTVDPSDLAWKFVTAASYSGPAGLKVGVTVVGTHSYSQPVFATQLIGSDANYLPLTGSMLSLQRRAVEWSAIFRIEKTVISHSAVHIRLVGEAFTPLGRDNEHDDVSPERQYLRSRAVRLGVALAF